MSLSPRLIACASLAALVLAGGDARAEQQALRVDYEAHEGCPTAASFLDEVLARASRARAAAPEEPALDVRVRITRRAPRSVGRLVLWKGSGLRIREVESDDCRDVVSALALITALAVDPDAARPGPAAPRPPATDTAPVPAPSPAPPQPPPQPPQDPWKMPVAPSSPFAPFAPLAPFMPRAPGPPVQPVAPPKRWVAGAQVALVFAVTPRPLYGGSLSIERSWGDARGVAARVAWQLVATGPFEIGPGAASFVRGAARAEGCPFFRPARWLAVGACLGVEAGFLRGEGLQRGSIARVSEVTVPWAALGLLPHVAVDVGDFAVVALDGGPAFPLVRRSFVFERPDYLIHDVPAVTGAVSLGGGIRF